ncbi:hypothetical protein AB0M91_06080 [Micromonospora rifamycinica]|uniref:hypothetical protein n=1 Tax=Micromonospora rifamycinica TaxID=291594 RepID=UPI0033DE7207
MDTQGRRAIVVGDSDGVDTRMAKSPVKPVLLGVERAADVVHDCLRTRPAVVSRPRRMAPLVRAAGVAARVAARR